MFCRALAVSGITRLSIPSSTTSFPTAATALFAAPATGFVADNYSGIYVFAQDDWKITPRLTLNLGIRYEYTTVPRDEGLQALNAIADDPARRPYLPQAQTRHEQHRSSHRFRMGSDRSRPWAVRGGAQVSYDVIPNNFPTNSLPPQLQTEQNPAITCSLPGAPRGARDPWYGFLAGGGLLQVNVPPTTQADARAATSSFIPDIVDPKIFTWSLGVQHQIMRDSSFEIRYVGTRSLDLPVQTRLNSASAFNPQTGVAPLTPLPTYINASDDIPRLLLL